MTNRQLVASLLRAVAPHDLAIAGIDEKFYANLALQLRDLHDLYSRLYESHPDYQENFARLLEVLVQSYKARSPALKKRDEQKESTWYLSNDLAGMSLYVDRFCGDLKTMPSKLDYLLDLGVNFLHLMPLFASPENESDGGYAVSDFRAVDQRFGTLEDLKSLGETLHGRGMYFMLDIVLNHASHQHAWAQRAKAGDPAYQEYFYFFPNRELPDQFEQSMPEVFPTAAPGNFSWVEECGQWVMTVFHTYQWDLNYRNPRVLVEMLDNVLFYANLGVDVLRIDAPAFLWKQLGTHCQNLPEAHTILQLLKKCVEVVAPGMALLGEAIVAPDRIMEYFGSGRYLAEECDFAYNATQMALQWDALATGQTAVMGAAQPILSQKPLGTSWITYTRCHDDIGLGYDDAMIEAAGFSPYAHRQYLKEYLSGQYPGSPARGALFAVNPKTQDARISGTLASLCGLEKGVLEEDESMTALAIRKILLMQATSFFLGGLPMIFYGDEAAYLNDYSFLDTPGKSYDNRWMHRPLIDWAKNGLTRVPGTLEYQVYSSTQKLLSIRKKLPCLSDLKNTLWLGTPTPQIAAFLRFHEEEKMYCLFNYSASPAYLTWHTFKTHGNFPARLFDHWRGGYHVVGRNEESILIEPYQFYLLAAVP